MDNRGINVKLIEPFKGTIFKRLRGNLGYICPEGISEGGGTE